MIEIEGKIVSADLLRDKFACDLSQCKGACCIVGDAGAPLEIEEVDILEEEYENYKPYMKPEGIEAIENDDVYDYDEKGALVTRLINNEECAFVYFHENGTALCAIEKAYLEGKIDFWKPISCHLYPIRLEEKNGFIYVNYHEWSVCVPAKRKGEKEGIPLYKFLKGPMIRRFGEDWYERFVKQINK